MPAPAWLAIVACKAVLTAAQTRGCRSIEFDVQVATDNVFVIAHDPVADSSDKHLTLDAFVAGLKGERFDVVNVDLKARELRPGDTPLTNALEKSAPALETLAKQSGAVVATSPVPARLEELERFLKKSGSGVQAGYELADYTAEDSDRWGLKLSRLERALLPVGRLMSRMYAKRRRDLKYLAVQERTAATMTAQPGRELICWTRDRVEGPPPPACRWTQREREK